MSIPMKRMTDYLIALGAAEVAHTGKGYLAHAIGVYTDIKAWGVSEDLWYAAIFHSIYGTQGFQGFTLPLDKRQELQSLIGEYAERLAYLNCFMDRATLDALVNQDLDQYVLRHRVTGEEMVLTRQEYDDLCTLHLCDWLEQAPRSNYFTPRQAAYRQMAERLGGVVLENFDRVFAQAPTRA